MLANYTFHHNYSKSFLFIVIYSIIGFGGQLPVGFWVDSKKQIKPFAIASLVLLPLAIGTYFIDAGAGIILSGIASAFVHVTGGTVCLQVHDNKTGPLALFTAPGVLGLTIGGLLGMISVYSLWFVLVLVIVVAYLILKTIYQLIKRRNKSKANWMHTTGSCWASCLLCVSALLFLMLLIMWHSNIPMAY